MVGRERPQKVYRYFKNRNLLRKGVELATKVKTRTGKTIILRDPAEKAKRYTRQLNKGLVTETGKKLSPTDKAFRIGYLAARNDSAKAFCSNHHMKSKSQY